MDAKRFHKLLTAYVSIAYSGPGAHNTRYLPGGLCWGKDDSVSLWGDITGADGEPARKSAFSGLVLADYGLCRAPIQGACPLLRSAMYDAEAEHPDITAMRKLHPRGDSLRTLGCSNMRMLLFSADGAEDYAQLVEASVDALDPLRPSTEADGHSLQLAGHLRAAARLYLLVAAAMHAAGDSFDKE